MTHICNTCGKEKPLTPEHYYRDKTTCTGFMRRCKECDKARLKKPEWTRYYREYKREERQRPEVAKARDEAKRKRKERHPERYARYKRATNQRRRKAWGKWTAKDFEQQYARQGGYCLYCLKPKPLDDMEVDHYVPISKGGRHDAWNIVAACPSCNRSKADKMPHEFMGVGA